MGVSISCPGLFWSPESLSGASWGEHYPHPSPKEQDSLEIRLQVFGFPGAQKSKLNELPTPLPPWVWAGGGDGVRRGLLKTAAVGSTELFHLQKVDLEASEVRFEQMLSASGSSDV